MLGSRCLLATIAILTSACGSAQTSQARPEDTVMALARELSDGNYAAAYARMSDDYKQRVSLAAWKKQVGESPDEIGELSSALAHVRGPLREDGRLSYGDGQELRVVAAGGRWLVATDLISFYDQSTPRAALRAFVRALSRKRYDMLLRLVPNADKESMTAERMESVWAGERREEVERLITSLGEHLEDPIEITGNHAAMPYGDRASVQFVREDDAWKIEDPE